MLTRLKINGFKNLVDVDVRFGAFTCIAGANGVGKSNLFDAIRFLSALADQTLVDAARMVRDDSAKGWDVGSLFQKVGRDVASTITFQAEMIIPKTGEDDLTQSPVEATSTLLRYQLTLARDESDKERLMPLRLVSEDLRAIRQGEIKTVLPFNRGKSWTDSVIDGRRTVPYISTDSAKGQPIINLHQDKQAGQSGGGRTFQHAANTLNRTVLSLANSGETPTTLMAKREMQSWRLMQLEPSALRGHDSFLSPSRLATNGAHLPATLYRLAVRESGSAAELHAPLNIYTRIGNRLHELLGDYKTVRVDRDEKRESLTLEVVDRSGTVFPARVLSDGTLRFLALSVLAEDPNSNGVICFEEPENGIHPSRITAIVKLLQDISGNTRDAVDESNPLRQVIINTHSPGVVGGIRSDDLLYARTVSAVRGKTRFPRIEFGCAEGGWRIKAHPPVPVATRAQIQEYLNPIPIVDPLAEEFANPAATAVEPQRNGKAVVAATRRRTKAVGVSLRIADNPGYQATLFDGIPAS